MYSLPFTEATSALDYHSEKLVQEALDKACKGRTTLVVSHRLSAIRHADQIVFIENGKAVEQGTHEDLIKKQGFYYKMVAAHEYDDTADELLNESEDAAQERKKSHDVEQFPSILTGLDKNSEFQMKRLNGNAELTKPDDAEKSKKSKTISYPRTFFRILSWARPEWSFLVIGTICAGLYGCAMPAFSVVLAELYASLAEPLDEDVLKRSSSMSIISVVIGICAAIFCFVQTFFYNLAGVWLTSRMR